MCSHIYCILLSTGEKPAVNNDSGSSDDEGAAGGDAATTTGKYLTIEQVDILNEDGNRKVVYPSRVDLNAPGFKVIREAN